MDKTLAEFIAYLKDNSGFERLLSAMKEKYQSYGTVKGTLIISNPTEWERQALGGLMQRDFRNAAQIRISTVLLKKSLKNTPYSALNPDDIVKAYFSSDIKSNKDIRKEKRQEEEDFFAGILNANQGTLSGKWLANILNDRGPGWDHIHRNYLADPIRLKEALINALNAGNNLPSPGSHVRLAFFSAGITGDPHTFDVGTMENNILLNIIRYIQNTKSDSQTAPYGNDNIRSVLKADLPYVLEGNIYTFLTEDSEGQVTALERLKLLYAVGILTEDILNNTTVYGISCIDENEKEHDGTRGFRHMKEPLIITLNLLLKTDRLLVSDSNIVYAVENSGVFSELVSIINESEKGGLSLICTNGQLTTASLMVFDMLKEQDVKVFYAGDFDPEGIKIADNLIRRYPMVEPWCMSPADYLDSDPQVELSPRRLSVLKNINNEILRNTADRLQKVGRTGYQERLIGKYLKSMNMY